MQKFTLEAFSHTSLHPFLQVTASFSLSRLPGGVPSFGSEFSCDATRGKVAPGGSRRVSVTYSPAVVDTVSVEYLSLNCKGTLSESLLKLSGRCIGKRPRHEGKLTFSVALVKHMYTPKKVVFSNNKRKIVYNPDSLLLQVPKLPCLPLWWILNVLKQEDQLYGRWSSLILPLLRLSTSGILTVVGTVCLVSYQQVALFSHIATPE